MVVHYSKHVSRISASGVFCAPILHATFIFSREDFLVFLHGVFTLVTALLGTAVVTTMC